MIYKLYGAINADADAIASIDIQNDGFINAMLIAMTAAGMDALSDQLRVEISFLSSNTLENNDSRGSLITMAISQNFLTTGGGTSGGNNSVSGLRIQVSQGERIFMHGKISTGVSGKATAYLYVDDGVDQKPARRRR